MKTEWWVTSALHKAKISALQNLIDVTVLEDPKKCSEYILELDRTVKDFARLSRVKEIK